MLVKLMQQLARLGAASWLTVMGAQTARKGKILGQTWWGGGWEGGSEHGSRTHKGGGGNKGGEIIVTHCPDRGLCGDYREHDGEEAASNDRSAVEDDGGMCSGLLCKLGGISD